MTRWALSAPLDVESRLADAARQHGHEVVARYGTGDELAIRLPGLEVDAVLVHASDHHLTESLVRECDRTGIRIIALTDTDAGRRLAAGYGIESRPADTELPELNDAIQVRTDPAQDRARGKIIAVWGPAGAPGRTCVAISLASELALAGASVALADVDVHAAAVAPSLGLLDESPGFAAACRLARTGALDVLELDRLAHRVETPLAEFKVLTGLARSDRWPELAPDRVTQTLEQCRNWVDWTVVDVAASLESDEAISSDVHAPHRNGATLAVLREADQVVAVAASDPIGLARFIRAHGELVDVLGHGKIRVVANKTRVDAAGLMPEGHVAQTLRRFAGIDEIMSIPWDPKAFDAALLSAQTLQAVAGRSRARRAVSDIARELMPPVAPQTRRQVRDEARGRAAVRLRLPFGRRAVD